MRTLHVHFLDKLFLSAHLFLLSSQQFFAVGLTRLN